MKIEPDLTAFVREEAGMNRGCWSTSVEDVEEDGDIGVEGHDDES